LGKEDLKRNLNMENGWFGDFRWMFDEIILKGEWI
jgi:hypothetical protein